MKRFLRILLWLGVVALFVVALVGTRYCSASTGTPKVADKTIENLRIMADSALKYCKQKGLSEEYCVLLDFKIHSGKNRLFVWDFKGDSLLFTSLCCHGNGGESTASKPAFSNVEGSYCSSLGHYKIGARSWSSYGINVHYKLHGLDKSNSNAYKRIIVLHSYEYVPERETYPSHLPLGMSLGCPVVSNDKMKMLDELIPTVKKPMLLWAYH